MVVYLMRHGETNAAAQGLYGRTPGIGLSAAGKIQAEKIACHLQDRPITAIYSSPLERAMETAAPLAARKGITVQVSMGFHEVEQGDWTGLSWQELSKDSGWRLYNTYRSGASCPNGEMEIEVQARAVRALYDLLDAHQDEQIAIVSHADVIRAALCYHAGVPLDLSLRIEIAPASISTLDMGRQGVRILGLNRVP